MRRRDYELLTRSFRISKPFGAGEEYTFRRDGWRGAVMQVAFELAQENPAFDKSRFLYDSEYDQ